MLRKQDITSLWLMARPLNVGIALLTFGLSAWLSALKTFEFVTLPEFALQALVTALIMTCGYWINDIFDYKIDLINKPEKTRVGPFISSKKAFSVYLAVSALTFGLNFLLPFKFWALNLTSIAILYVYALYLKKKAVFGNLAVSWLTSAVFLAGGLVMHFKLVHVWGMMFAFMITFIREVTKDVEDMKGDMAFGLETLPLTVGIRTTKKVLAVSYNFLGIACWFPFIFEWLKFDIILTNYLIFNLLLVQLPLIYIFILLLKSKNPPDFGTQSRLLKPVIVTGLIGLMFM